MPSKPLPTADTCILGGDEVHVGKSHLCKVSGLSALELHLYWLRKVCAFAQEHNRIPIMWDDMPLKHAGLFKSTRQTNLSQSQADQIWNQQSAQLVEHIEKFPPNCVYMRWEYCTPELPGNRNALRWYQEHDLHAMTATAAQTAWTVESTLSQTSPGSKRSAADECRRG